PGAPRRPAPPKAGDRSRTNDQSARDTPRAPRRVPRDKPLASLCPVAVGDRETDLEGDLIMRNLAVLDMAAGLDDLEPAQVAQGLRRAGDGALDRVVDALVRRTDDLNDAVDMIVHGVLPEKPRWETRGR